MRGLIGYTGTIGKNLLNYIRFDKLYNTKNINEIAHQDFDELYLSCLPATKWYVNTHEHEDNNNTKILCEILKTVKAKYVVLISTIDVYPIKNSRQTENCIMDFNNESIVRDVYGKNRLLFEKFIMNTYEKYSIFRLPGIFGNYLKKNVIYDLVNDNNISNINQNSIFQWYYLNNLAKDINKYKDYSIINLFSEPICTNDIINALFPSKNINNNSTSTVIYDICSELTDTGYIYTKEETMGYISEYLDELKYIDRKILKNITLSNLAWNNNEMNQIISIMKENEINRIELVLTKYDTWSDLDIEKVINIKKYFDEKKIIVYSLQSITFGLDCNEYNIFINNGEKLLEHCNTVLTYAKILGCKLIVFGSPKYRTCHLLKNTDDVMPYAMTFFTKLNTLAQNHDIIVCIEPNARVYNCDFLWNLSQTYNFVKELNKSHIRMMIDTGCMSLENDSINYKYNDMIEHIHLSEPYLEELTLQYINHISLKEKLLFDDKLKKLNFTIEIKGSNDNISKINNTMRFLKKYYSHNTHILYT